MLTAHQSFVNVGRRGMPPEVKAAMLADYYELRSLEKVAAKWGRTRQAMWENLRRAGCKFFLKNPQAFIIHHNRKFTPGKGGYFRSTQHDTKTTKRLGLERMLHRQVWIDHHGAIPAGHQVGFKDGNKANCVIDNLICMPLADIVRLKATGQNGFTKTADARLKLLVNAAATGGSLSSQLKHAA